MEFSALFSLRNFNNKPFILVTYLYPPLSDPPTKRHDVVYVQVGVLASERVLKPAAHCFPASAESFNLSAEEERDEGRLGSILNVNFLFEV